MPQSTGLSRTFALGDTEVVQKGDNSRNGLCPSSVMPYLNRFTDTYRRAGAGSSNGTKNRQVSSKANNTTAMTYEVRPPMTTWKPFPAAATSG